MLNLAQLPHPELFRDSTVASIYREALMPVDACAVGVDYLVQMGFPFQSNPIFHSTQRACHAWGYAYSMAYLSAVRAADDENIENSVVIDRTFIAMNVIHKALELLGYSSLAKSLLHYSEANIKRNIESFLVPLAAAGLNIFSFFNLATIDLESKRLQVVDPESKRLKVIEDGRITPCNIHIFEGDEEDPLGRGGTSTVYRGTIINPNTSERTAVAVKILEPRLYTREEASKSFVREMYFQKIFKGRPDIVQIHACGSLANGSLYLTMEIIEGESLESFIEKMRVGEISPALPDLIHIIQKIADTLNHVHSKGVAHLDIKGANFYLLPDGRILLADFGNAVEFNSPETRNIYGHPITLPPEVMRKALTREGHGIHLISPEGRRKWDLWAFAMMAYQLLSGGKNPYCHTLDYENSKDIQSLTAKLMDCYGNNPSYRPLREDHPEIPEEVDVVLKRCLSIDPEGRSLTMAEVSATLSRCLPDEIFRAALATSNSQGDTNGIKNLLIEWDEDLFLRGRHAQQQEIFKISEQYFGDLFPLAQAEFHLRYARALDRQGKVEEGKTHLKNAKRLIANDHSAEAASLKIRIIAEEIYYHLPDEAALSVVSIMEGFISKDISPRDQGLFYWAEMCVFRRAKNHKDALEAAQKALRIYEQANELQRANEMKAAIGNCLIDLERYDEAVSLLEGACTDLKQSFFDRGPNAVVLYANYADALRLAGHVGRSIDILNETLSRYPRSPYRLDLLFYLGQAYHQQKNWSAKANVIEDMRRLARRSPTMENKASGYINQLTPPINGEGSIE